MPMRRGTCLALPTIGIAIGAFVIVAISACGTSYPPCYRGEYRACSCEAQSAGSFTTGYQACSVTEDGFGACTCDGTTPGVDGGRDAAPADATPVTSEGTYLTSCETTACVDPTTICFSYDSKGKRCTKTCKVDSDCPPPSPGCNPKSVCKLP